MLKHKRADYLIDYQRPVERAIKLSENSNKVHLYFDNIGYFDVHFVVSKKTPNAAKILQDLESSYHTLRSIGPL